MATKYFINIEDLKEESLIHENVSTDLLKVILARTQRMNLTKLLGKDLYDDLLDKADAGTLADKDLILYDDWLKPYLIIKVEEMASLNFNIEIRNKSVGTSNDEYQTASDMTTIDKFKNDLVKQAQFYKVGLVEYIEDNIEDFPLYPRDCKDIEKAGDSMSYVFGTVVNRVR
jgi:hypothetical protein